jgi:hypothetical protein
MTREMKTKRVLFYCTVILFFVSPFAFENVVDNGLTDGTIFYYSTLITFVFATVASFWGCTKKEFEKITGIDFFSEK